MKRKFLNLQFFGEGGGDGSGATSTAGSDGVGMEGASNEVSSQKGKKGNPLANVVYGKQDAEQPSKADIVVTPTALDKASEFESMIKGDYKQEFDSRVQNIIDKRFAKSKGMEDKLNALSPMLDMLREKYGTDENDIDGLVKAIQDDDAYYEDEAIKKGLTVKQLKELKQLERDNASLRQAQQEAQARQQSDMIYSKWMNQTNDFNQKYGMNIDFALEVQNPDFSGMLKNGVSVEAAYRAVHFDEMMGGAMFKTAEAVSQKMANNIQSRSQRPSENGISSRATTVTKTDVNSLTRKDREEIERRVARGERISF